MISYLFLTVGGLVAGITLTVGLSPRRSGRARSTTEALSSVSVIVPVRNEVRNLPGLIESLRSAGLAHELIVVDDGSTDGTAKVASDLGCRVIELGDPPRGWLGKPHACQAGADAATGETLVFVDADVRFEPDGLRDVVAMHAQRPDGLLSVQPFHEVETVYEHASTIPNVVSMMASGAFRAGGDGSSTLAFGPCMVVSTATYRDAGGHRAVRSSIIEDVALAAAVVALGRPVRCAAGNGKATFRMYPDGVSQLYEGWSKNLASGAAAAPPLLVLGSIWWVTSLYAATLELSTPSIVGAVTYVALATHLAWVLRRIGSFRWWAAPLFPLLLAAFTVCFTGSVIARIRGRTTWRGRTIPLSPHLRS